MSVRSGGADGLLGVARGIAGRARAGEQVEAYVVHSRDTDVKVFDGDVESLSVAEVDGVGVRVLVDGRQGYAWAGSLEPEVVADTLAEARDNATFGVPDEWQALATPDDAAAVEAPRLDLWRDDLLAVPTDDKVALALELERATRAGDPRVRGVEAAVVRRRRDRGGRGELVGRRGGGAPDRELVRVVRARG